MRSPSIIALAIAISLGAAATPASATMMSGDALLRQCDAGVEMCAWYVAGVIDQWGGFADPVKLEKLKKCMPNGSSLLGFLEMTKDYLAAHPDQGRVAGKRDRRRGAR